MSIGAVVGDSFLTFIKFVRLWRLRETPTMT